MSEITIWDSLFALALFVVFPIYSRFTIDEVLNDIREGGETVRINTYKQVIVTWVLFSACLIGLWFVLDRPWAELGIRGADPMRQVIGLGIAAFVVAVVVLPIRSLLKSGDGRSTMDEQLGGMALFMPSSRNEEKWFKGVSVSAGLTEELIFRGYLLWYLQHFVNIWWAAAGAIVLFGLAHLYQGLKMLPGILMISAVAVFLYLYTQSLLIPIVFHIAIDAFQGHYIAKIRRLTV